MEVSGQTAKDDVISVLFIFADFIIGNLPWSGSQSAMRLPYSSSQRRGYGNRTDDIIQGASRKTSSSR